MGVVQILSVLFRMTCRSLIFLALVAAGQAAIAPAAEYEDAQAGIRFTEEDKLRLVKELEDEELSKEIENLVSNLDDEQLEQLEEILAKDLDEASEFDMLMAELKEMGMDEEDIKDLLELSGSTLPTPWRTTSNCTCSACPTTWAPSASWPCTACCRTATTTLST